jgi:RNA polymerase sigma-70 factor (ECF subfamily)
MLNNREEAEDCVQEIFLKLWTKRESLSTIKNIRAFSLQMTRNLCLDKIKSKKNSFTNLNAIEDVPIASEVDLYKHVELQDILSRMHQIILQLPEQQRIVLHLRNIEGLEMEEISEITGLNINHLRVTLSRSRMAVREMYQKLYGHA